MWNSFRDPRQSEGPGPLPEMSIPQINPELEGVPMQATVPSTLYRKQISVLVEGRACACCSSQEPSMPTGRWARIRSLAAQVNLEERWAMPVEDRILKGRACGLGLRLEVATPAEEFL